MEKLWIEQPRALKIQVDRLMSELPVNELVAELLIQRGILSGDTAKSFFRPSLNDLHDPFLMMDMEKAVERLTKAIHLNEKILVYGDYDVDGTTAVTVMYSFLKKIGVTCDYYIPDRYNEGYGFSFLGVDYAKENGFSLIITLDCGIRDGVKIDYASENGIDVIVCDHHNPEELPGACAVLDPKRPDCSYPFKGLSGCGVGFKLIQAFCIQQSIPQEEIFEYLDLLTISIGADIVPLTGENRILAFHGLKQLAAFKRPGIAAMLEKASMKKKELSITDVVFILAPRINAAGRIFSGKQAVALLLAEDTNIAAQLIPALEENNKTRKSLDKEITAEAISTVAGDSFYSDSFTTVVCGKSWHKGVVGIVASRLVEAYYKPTIVLTDDGTKMSGSARSIEGIDLFDVLGKCSDLLEQFGGHAMAAGLSLKSENFLAFRKKFDAVVTHMLNHKKPQPFIRYDREIHLEEITPAFYNLIKRFAPFGPDNMKPVFVVRNILNAKFTRPVGETKAHLKLHVAQKHNINLEMDGIAFDLGHWAEIIKSGKEVDLILTIDENEWNGQINIQLNVKDIRLHSDQPLVNTEITSSLNIS